MAHQTRFLIVVALVLLVAGVAAAQSLLAGPSPGLAADNTTVAQSTTQGSTPTTTTPTSPSGTTGTTPSGSTTGGTPTPTPAPSTPTTTTPGSTATSGMTVDQIVSLTRTVDAGVPAVSAFTVPAGRLLVVTDVLVTNTGTAPACGASISAGGATAAPTTPTTPGTTTPGATTPSAATPGTTSESGTGVLCVPAQTSLNLGLTTGMEFSAGQNVVLANAQSTGGGTLHYHLRGFLAIPSGA
jgi:hypothetical protein